MTSVRKGRFPRLQSRAEYIRNKLDAGMKGPGWDWELVDAIEWSIKQIALLEELCIGKAHHFRRRFERLDRIPESLPISGRAGTKKLQRLQEHADFLRSSGFERQMISGYAAAE